MEFNQKCQWKNFSHLSVRSLEKLQGTKITFFFQAEMFIMIYGGEK